MAKGQWDHYIGSRSKAEYAEDSVKAKKFVEDEEYKATRMAQMTKAFTDADANSDGLLDEAEYANWAVAMKQLAKDNGDFTDDREGIDK